MSKQIAILISDDGDGTSSLRWFKDVELAEEARRTFDQFNVNEDINTITVPDDWEPEEDWDDEVYQEYLEDM